MVLLSANFICLHFTSIYITQVNLITPCWSDLEKIEALKNCNLKSKFQETVKFEHNANLGIYLNLDCLSEDSLDWKWVQYSEELSLFSSNCKWLISSQSNETYKIFLKRMENVNLYSNADISFALLGDYSVETYQIFNNGKVFGGVFNASLDKTFDCLDGNCKKVSQTSTRTKYEDRSDYSDITLNLASVITTIPISLPEEDLVQHLTKIDEVKGDVISRFGTRFVFVLRDMLNFKWKFIHTNSWTNSSMAGGAIGEMMSNRAQFIMSPYVFNQIRATRCVMLVKVGMIKNVFIFRTPENQGLFSSALFRPFDPPIWGCILAVLFIFGFYLVPVFKHENLYQNLKFKPDVLTVLMIAHGQFCAQTSHFDPQSKSGRLAFIALMSCTFLLFNYYTSVLVGLFISSPPQSNIENLYDLADSNFDIGIDDVPFIHAYFNSTVHKDVQYFFKKKVLGAANQSKIWMDQTEGLKRVKQGGFAYSAEVSTFYHSIENQFSPQDMFDINELVLRLDKNLAMILPQESPYREIFKIRCTRILESGVLNKLRKYWLKEKLSTTKEVPLISVGLGYTLTIFLFLIGSYTLAVIVMGIEYILYYKVKLFRTQN